MKTIYSRLVLPFAVALVAYLVVANGSGRSQAKPSSVDGDELLLNVSVREKSGVPATGLSRENFSVLIDKSAADLESFGAGDTPESISLLVDRSASMRGNQAWTAAVRELNRLPGLSNNGSEFFLLSFNHKLKVVA